jgi:UDP-glucose 4-epimerase
MFIGDRKIKVVYQGADRGWNGDIPHYRCDISKLKALGWNPSVKSDDAVKLTISKL